MPLQLLGLVVVVRAVVGAHLDPVRAVIAVFTVVAVAGATATVAVVAVAGVAAVAPVAVTAVPPVVPVVPVAVPVPAGTAVGPLRILPLTVLVAPGGTPRVVPGAPAVL
jgi:hypothetical protein